MAILGAPREATLDMNCRNCAKFYECDDAHKGMRYACSWHETLGKAPAEIPDFKPLTDRDIKSPGRLFNKAESFMASMQRLIVADSYVPLNAPIDERDVPVAKNFLQFIRSRHFLQCEPEPFAKHYQFGTLAFAEWCPRCSDADWLYNTPVEADIDEFRYNVQELEFGVCPRCQATQTEMINEGELPSYQTIALLLGQRSTKSTWTGGQALPYLTHRILTLPDPSRYYGLRADQLLSGMFVAQDYAQVMQMWDPYLTAITKGPWFVNYHQQLRDASNKLGRELFKLGEMSVLWRHKNLGVGPAAPDKRRLRGRTSVFVAPDELGWFDVNRRDKVSSAEEIVESLNNSLSTVQRRAIALRRQGRNNVPMATSFCISSGSSDHDMMSKFLTHAKTNPTIYAVKYPTWDVNPDYTEASVARDYAHLNWRRDYGCIFSSNDDNFFPSIDMLRDLVDKDRKQAVIVKASGVDLQGANGSRNHMLSGMLEWINPDETVKKVMVLDSGWSNNSLAIAVGHIYKDLVYVDALAEIIPTPSRRIWFHGVMSDVVLPIVQKLNVQLIVSDLWQSVHLMQEVGRKAKIETRLGYRVKYSDYSSYKDDVISGRFRLPNNEIPFEQIREVGAEDYRAGFLHKPVSHLIYQSVTSVDNGAVVDKAVGATDDLLRVCVLLRAVLYDEDYRDMFYGRVPLTDKTTVFHGVPQLNGDFSSPINLGLSPHFGMATSMTMDAARFSQTSPHAGTIGFNPDEVVSPAAAAARNFRGVAGIPMIPR